MPRRPDSRERLLSGTALRRRPGQPNPELESNSATAGSQAESTVPVARGTAARRNRALKLSEQPQPSRPTGARRPGVLSSSPIANIVRSQPIPPPAKYRRRAHSLRRQRVQQLACGRQQPTPEQALRWIHRKRCPHALGPRRRRASAQ